LATLIVYCTHLIFKAHHDARNRIQPPHGLAKRLHRIRRYIAAFDLHDGIFTLDFGIADYIKFHDAIYATICASIARVMVHAMRPN